MTGEEAYIALKIKLDKNDTQSLPEVPVEQGVFWLNDAFSRIIKHRYGGNNPKRESFEETQKRTDDLREVIKYETIGNPANGFFPNSKDFDLPEDYWFAVVEQCDVTYKNCVNQDTTERVGVTAVQHNNINTAVTTDPFWKPLKSDVLRVMHGRKTTIFHEAGGNVTQYYLGYVQNGFKIDLNDLTQPLAVADHLHSEIVDLAYNMILNAVESQRYQQDLLELSKSE